MPSPTDVEAMESIAPDAAAHRIDGFNHCRCRCPPHRWETGGGDPALSLMLRAAPRSWPTTRLCAALLPTARVRAALLHTTTILLPLL
jgi:hypothetical protein